MKDPLIDIDLIERYFDNALSPEETAYFENRLDNDAAFRELFARERLLINTIRYERAVVDLRFLKEKESTLSNKARPGFGSYWYYIAAAACVSLIALAVLTPWSKETPQTLYAQYFKPYPNVFEPVMRGNLTMMSRAQAFQAYELGDYETALIGFSRLMEEKKEPGILLLLGNSNLMLGNTADARRNFTELMQGWDELDAEAKWYLALISLREGNTREAEQTLREIAGSDHPFAMEAAEILRELQ